MATWQISTLYKKSAYEITYWFKDGKRLSREEGYRWGTFECDSDERPDVDLGDDFEVDGDWELVELDDGCWADWTFPDDISEEEQEQIEAAWDEDYFEGLEELGWIQDDTEYFLNAPLKLVNKDTGEEFTYDSDETEVTVTEAKNESKKFEATAAWPFGNVDDPTK